MKSIKEIMGMARGLAKQLDTPEMRKLYRSEKLKDNTLDDRVDELTEELQEEFKHDKDS